MLNQKKVVFGKGFSLYFFPFMEKRVYGFKCQNFENEELSNTVHYEIEVECIQSHYNNCIFEINRKQVFIDQQAPDLKIEQIAEACAQAIFPIRVKIDQEGSIVEIVNHKAIKQRWIPIKERLLKYYQGNIVPEIILRSETVLLNENLLEKSICKNWFFHLYFKPLYIGYTPDKLHDYIWESPVFGNQIIKYDVNHTIEEHYSATDKIFINAKGKSIDERTIDEVLNGCSYPKSKMAGIVVAPLKSEMEVQYKLYGEDRSIFSIIGSYKTKITEQKQKITQVEIYHLPENSSFRPQSGKVEKENRESYQSYKNKEDEDIIDIFATIKNHQPKPRLDPRPIENRISLLVVDEPVEEKLGFWSRSKLFLKRNS
jgi:hypothetical protein